MTPAVRRALAYVAATGRIPTHLHIGTWSKVRDAVTDADSACVYRVRPEHAAAVACDPLAIACEWFRARGFKVESGGRSTSHVVTWHRDGFTGYAYRSGGGTLYVEHGAAALDAYAGTVAPFRTSYALDVAGKAWPCILRPGMYAGDRAEGESGRAYLERALAAYAA